MFKIVFTENGKVVNVHDGYTSYNEARMAIRDMDMMIPFTWSYKIEEA